MSFMPYGNFPGWRFLCNCCRGVFISCAESRFGRKYCSRHGR